MYNWRFSQTLTPHRLAPGESILFDPGEQLNGVGGALPTNTEGFNVDSQGRVWNCDAIYKDLATVGPAIAYAQNTAGINTTVNIEVVSPFVGRDETGVTAGSIYDPLVAVDGWQSSATIIGKLMYEGLTPGEAYNVAMFGSDTASNRTGNYTVTDANGTHSFILNATNNTTGQAIFDDMIANAEGDLTLSVVPVAGSQYADINAISITAVPEPAGLAFVGMGVMGMKRRRREIGRASS
jgi:hypothetical protein